MIEPEKTENCLGYYGFGSGFVMAKRDGAGGSYCENCKLAKACWPAHRDRARAQFPDAMAEMDRRVASGLMGPELINGWFAEFGMATPDVAMMVGNMEDGARVGSGLSVANRGPFTVPYPFRLI